ncbi:dinitrogenase iron-molybdenum cofactor [Pyrococcus furiosus DSM 3638]|uniref:Dinitrogenase iron-molybdenum cofactor n=3 Tax=Pyrococcus furiosus TaxID=2261 RepID=A0A5C0XS55_PYRFU|nr:MULTISPECIES: NifB/NifX family molybdenum-iron cluster-binding protein [Pyrococcus]AAL82149.1 hypothetical protein PF2025 [Pyrococcus furiosus DSM 3638]AFN04617.1 hypothetical protein PFC_08435 [Pyrococcus furiosus COM1]MDK2869569.1 hypothetical protein [Pyrococcus sp.]QEK79619.1 dinitrogenase iron-molybdenum cofactor [Pyrococcus furiosus DSM 3638]
MKIAIPTNGGGREDTVAPLFARAPAFYIAEVDEKGNIISEKVIQNPAATAGRGAGPIAVQMLINEGVDTIVAPQVVPNALGAIQAAGIRVYYVTPGTPVEEAIKVATTGQGGQLPSLPQIPTPVTPAPAMYGPVYPPFGWGRGWGKGRGWGRGWGSILGYCPWTGMPSRRALRWYYGWW